MTTEQIKNILIGIVNDQCGIILNDKGSGSAGPGYAGPDMIAKMLENGDFEDTEVVDFDAELARDSFAGQCEFDKATEWTQIEFNFGENGYRLIAWIWEA